MRLLRSFSTSSLVNVVFSQFSFISICFFNAFLCLSAKIDSHWLLSQKIAKETRRGFAEVSDFSIWPIANWKEGNRNQKDDPGHIFAVRTTREMWEPVLSLWELIYPLCEINRQNKASSSIV